jgi:2-methylcitrate dehydratase PrpD
MNPLYLEALADFIVDTKWKSLPAEVIRAVKRVFIDALGANMRGSEEPENARLSDFFMSMSGVTRRSTLLREDFPLADYLTAAFVNGTQACSVELDDGYRHAMAHASAYVMSGVMALSEELDTSAVEMLTAHVIGYEIASRGSMAARVPKFVINQHGVMSSIGTAAAACKLRHYDKATTMEVLRIAASFAHVTSYAALLQGATVRNLWVGSGNRDGLLAAEFAKMGFLGMPDGIRVTFERATAEFDESRLTDDLGVRFCITENYHKQYACCGNFDASVEATLSLVKENAINPRDIERILVQIYSPYHTLDEGRPRNALAAKFSLRYCVAAAAVCGTVGHDVFASSKLADPSILALIDRTQLREDSQLAANLPVVRPARVTIRLSNGREFVRLVEDTRGHYENPFSDGELEAKFAGLAGRYMTEEGVNAVLRCIKDAERTSSVRMITGAMRKNARKSSSANL